MAKPIVEKTFGQLYSSVIDALIMSVGAVLVSPKSLLDSITAFELLTRLDDGQSLREMQIPSTLRRLVIYRLLWISLATLLMLLSGVFTGHAIQCNALRQIDKAG